MNLPRMGPDSTALDHARGGRAVTTAMCIHEARAHIQRTGEAASLVYRTGRPVGVVTAVALERACMVSSEDGPITSVMDYLVVPVDRHDA